MYEDKLANIRGAVMMSYPMGLPAWDPVALCIEGVEGLDGTQAAADLLEADQATLWVASKDFPRGQKVRAYGIPVLSVERGCERCAARHPHLCVQNEVIQGRLFWWFYCACSGGRPAGMERKDQGGGQATARGRGSAGARARRVGGGAQGHDGALLQATSTPHCQRMRLAMTAACPPPSPLLSRSHPSHPSQLPGLAVVTVWRSWLVAVTFSCFLPRWCRRR